MQLTLSIILEKEIKAKNDSKVSYLVEVVKKIAPIVFNWRLLAVVTATGQISINFMDDLKRLVYYI